MYILLKLLHRIKSNNWFNITSFIILIYVIGLSLMVVEPETFTDIKTYTWWFIVTSSTVGYGDIFPITNLGRLIAVFVIVGGIGSLAMIIGKVSEFVINVNKIKVKGLKSYKMKDHIVLMGYHPEETPNIINEVIKDQGHCNIILCTDELEENPYITDECVNFVKGKLISDDVLSRASIATASKILIHAPNDNESIAVLLAVLNTNHDKKTNVVLYMEDDTYNKHVEDMVFRMGRCVETVTDVKLPLMIQSLLDSGVSDMVNGMLDSEGSSIRSKKYVQPYAFTFSEYSNIMYQQNDAILIGVNKEFHPKPDYLISPGDTLYYFGEKRLNKA